MSLLGAHMSIAGGYYKAVEAAAEYAMDVVQIFTKNNNQWRAKPISDDEAARFQQALKETKITHPLSHSSYLINLASPDKELWSKSVDAFVIELQRAEKLGIAYVVVHPGSFTTSSEEEGIAKVIEALNETHQRLPDCQAQCLLENTAGQGTNLGWKFEHLAAMIDGVKAPERLGVCFDTCHAFAAGYPLAEEKDFKATMKEFDRVVGLKKIKAFHLNDSKRELGARVDRHEHIGHGCLGADAFRHLLHDRRFRKIPMYLETAKDKDEKGRDWDAVNMQTLRELAK